MDDEEERNEGRAGGGVCELEKASNKFTEWDKNREGEKDQKEWIDKEEDIIENYRV